MLLPLIPNGRLSTPASSKRDTQEGTTPRAAQTIVPATVFGKYVRTEPSVNTGNGGRFTLNRPALNTGMSNMTQRANERFLEVGFKGSAATQSGQREKKRNAVWAPQQEQEQRRDVFGEILKQVEVLSGVGSAEIITLKNGKAVEDFCAPNCQKVYRFALPAKPAIVTVQLERFYDNGQEGTLSIFASTETDKPSSQNHQLFGESSVEYTHCFKEPIEGNDGKYIDRRKVVPDKKYVYVSIEFSLRSVECRYRIICSLHKMAILLTEDELRERPAAPATRGWERKIHEIKNDPVKKTDFDDTLKQLQQAQEERNHNFRITGNHIKKNRTIVSAMVKHTQHCHSAIKSAQHHTEIQKRKVAMNDDLAQRRVEWLHRAEVRRAKLQAEAEEEGKRELELERSEKWFSNLMLYMATVVMANRFAEKKKKIQEWYEENFASKVIQKFWMSRYAKRRRSNMYWHLVRFNTGMITYIRIVGLANRFGACHIMLGFIRNTTANTENPRACIHRYVKSIYIVQHHWARIKRTKEARLEIYLHMWRGIEEDINNSMVEETSASAPVGARKTRRGSNAGNPTGAKSLGVATVKKEEPAKFQKSKTVALESLDKKDAKTAGEDEKEDRKKTRKKRDPVPDVVVTTILKDLIKSSMRQWVEAFLAYKAEKNSLTSIRVFETQLEQVAKGRSVASVKADGFQNVITAPRPSSFLINVDRLQKLVNRTYEDWKAGKYEYLLKPPEEAQQTPSRHSARLQDSKQTNSQVARKTSKQTVRKTSIGDAETEVYDLL